MTAHQPGADHGCLSTSRHDDTIGLLEVLGALGLILPGALGIAPMLVPVAAMGLAVTMVGAIATHLRRGEYDRLAVPLVLFAPALFVAIERFGAHSL
jgi:hypothetical protein